jgi:hypothetical protein
LRCSKIKLENTEIKLEKKANKLQHNIVNNDTKNADHKFSILDFCLHIWLNYWYISIWITLAIGIFVGFMLQICYIYFFQKQFLSSIFNYRRLTLPNDQNGGLKLSTKNTILIHDDFHEKINVHNDFHLNLDSFI